jgi:hypothetical protein
MRFFWPLPLYKRDCGPFANEALTSGQRVGTEYRASTASQTGRSCEQPDHVVEAVALADVAQDLAGSVPVAGERL